MYVCALLHYTILPVTLSQDEFLKRVLRLLITAVRDSFGVQTPMPASFSVVYI